MALPHAVPAVPSEHSTDREEPAEVAGLPRPPFQGKLGRLASEKRGAGSPCKTWRLSELLGFGRGGRVPTMNRFLSLGTAIG